MDAICRHCLTINNCFNEARTFSFQPVVSAPTEWHLCLYPASGKNTHTHTYTVSTVLQTRSPFCTLFVSRKFWSEWSKVNWRWQNFSCFLVNNQNVLCSAVYLLASILHILFIFSFISKQLDLHLNLYRESMEPLGTFKIQGNK